MKPSKLLISTLVVIALMASADGVSHAQKKSTFFIPVSERNYAQKLGGYSMDDYSLYEGNIDYSKKKNKPLIQEKVFSSYQEAFDNLPALPDPSEIDTEEKIVEYLNELNKYTLAVELHEPKDVLEHFRDSVNKAQMDNAIRASKGLPYDTELHFDPKASRYMDLLNKKMGAFVSPIMKKAQNTVSAYEVVSDPGCADLVSYNNVYAERDIYKAMTPLRKQICQEWFASACCKKIAQMDAPLVERAKAERPRRAPEWFIEGRKAEQAEVEAYNLQVAKRWLAKMKPFVEREKDNIKKLLSYYEEVDAIRGDDPMTKEYMSTKLQAAAWVESFFQRYYGCLFITAYTPLIKTPPTQEGAKKFVIE